MDLCLWSILEHPKTPYCSRTSPPVRDASQGSRKAVARPEGSNGLLARSSPLTCRLGNTKITTDIGQFGISGSYITAQLCTCQERQVSSPHSLYNKEPHLRTDSVLDSLAPPIYSAYIAPIVIRRMIRGTRIHKLSALALHFKNRHGNPLVRLCSRRGRNTVLA